jgi:glycine C-acetyltransferase
VFDLIDNGDALRRRLYANADLFRTEMTRLGFTLAGEGHPIIPVMLGDAALAQEMASRMLARGVYVIGFSFPVVPRGPGTHPHPDVGGARRGGCPQGHRRLRGGRA